MNAHDLLDAERLWSLLDSRGRDEAMNLAPQLRATGLESTLRWLETKSETLGRSLCDILNVPQTVEERGRRNNLELLADSRRALAVAEALHLFARACHGAPQ